MANRNIFSLDIKEVRVEQTCSFQGVCSRYVAHNNWALLLQVWFWLWGLKADLNPTTSEVWMVRNVAADQKCILAWNHFELYKPTAGFWNLFFDWQCFSHMVVNTSVWLFVKESRNLSHFNHSVLLPTLGTRLRYWVKLFIGYIGWMAVNLVQTWMLPCRMNVWWFFNV